VADEFDDRVLIGEIYLPLARLVAYYGESLNGVQLPFNFQLLQCAWNARSIAKLIDQYEAALPTGGWPNWVLGNHDNPRIASRVGTAQARAAAMMLLTLRGTPTMYYGDELGMQNVHIPPDRIQDPLEKNVPGAGLGRDPSRTPMQWDATLDAGFSVRDPWLPVSADVARVNAASEDLDPSSMLSLYRSLLDLRRRHTALSVGGYQAVAASGDVLGFIRCTQDERFLVVLNLGPHAADFSLEAADRTATALLSTYLDRQIAMTHTHLSLRPNEGVILALESPTAAEAP
jgi:alpha-glucosidase